MDLFAEGEIGQGIGYPETFYENQSRFIGNDWQVNLGGKMCWGGPLGIEYNNPPGSVAATREVVYGTGSDGSQKFLLRIANEGTEGYSAFWNCIYNFNGFLPDTEYTLVVTCIAYPSIEGEATGNELRQCFIRCSEDKNGSLVTIPVDGQWHTYVYTFRTRSTISANTAICIGPDDSSAFMSAGFEMDIENAYLYGPRPVSTLEDVTPKDFSGYGLSVDENGTILLGGSEFYGYGVNFHGAFYQCLDGIGNPDAYFRTLYENNIPYARVMMGIFYPNEVARYGGTTDPIARDKFFRAMDQTVALAEKYHVGIVASLMWNDSAFYVYSGEDLTSLGDPDAKGTKLAVSYVKDVVSRYKYSPAIWAWEIGNEGNLGVDLWPEHGTVHSTAQLTAYYTIIGNAIREEDPYRMICGGDSAPRPYSHSLRNGHGWSYQDDYEMTKESLSLYTPGDLDTVSLHIYEYSDANRLADMVNAAKDLRIGLYVGEFGAGNYTDPDGDPDSEKDCWYYVVDKLLEQDIQMCIQWCYGREAQLVDYTSLETGVINGVHRNEYMLTKLTEINNDFNSSGKNKATGYWDTCGTTFYDGN